MIETGTSAPAPNVAGPITPLSQVLSELVASLTTLLESQVTAENQAEHNVDVTKLREQIAKAQEDINAESACMVELQT